MNEVEVRRIQQRGRACSAGVAEDTAALATVVTTLEQSEGGPTEEVVTIGRRRVGLSGR